jgi:hypothetical protein
MATDGATQVLGPSRAVPAQSPGGKPQRWRECARGRKDYLFGPSVIAKRSRSLEYSASDHLHATPASVCQLDGGTV